MTRPAIPSEIRRAVLVEAGHRCSIPRCSHPDVDVHHITPWEVCQRHEYSNLIALCPNCHRRAHKGEIDRKSLLLYKAALVASFRAAEATPFSAPVIEIKRRLYEVDASAPSRVFDFEFPEFLDSKSRIASKNLEAWGSELLADFGTAPLERRSETSFDEPSVAWLTGRYSVVRRDAWVLSVRYKIEQMFSGAAHRSSETRVQNFLLSPFQPLPLTEALRSEASLSDLSELVRADLLRPERNLCAESVRTGTAARVENFSLFVMTGDGVAFLFPEYQVASYAEGEHWAYLDFGQLGGIFRDDILAALRANDLEG